MLTYHSEKVLDEVKRLESVFKMLFMQIYFLPFFILYLSDSSDIGGECVYLFRFLLLILIIFKTNFITFIGNETIWGPVCIIRQIL